MLATAPAPRNSDSDYPYRHDSYFYYLTGFTEPEAPWCWWPRSATRPRAILFCRPRTSNAKSGTATAMARRRAHGLRLRRRAIEELDAKRACLPTPPPCTTRWAAASMQVVQAGGQCAKARSGVTAPAIARRSAGCWTKCAC
jgi:Xaa-Pro aminopeptidase